MDFTVKVNKKKLESADLIKTKYSIDTYYNEIHCEQRFSNANI